MYNYSTKKIGNNMARAALVDSPISTKTSIEIANYLRGRQTSQAKMLLEQSIGLKKAIPYKRFTNGPGHKRGRMASGRYSVKACEAFIGLIKSAESNAHDKGLNTKSLVIKRLVVQKAASPWHYGRRSRIRMKRSHVEIVLEEKEPKAKEKTEKKELKPEKQVQEKKAEKSMPETPNVLKQEVPEKNSSIEKSSKSEKKEKSSTDKQKEQSTGQKKQREKKLMG